jgi:ubiquinone/menaquinone biosynthesis C-methylase UbiE
MDIKTVYDNIAGDFSRTRYKVWNGVANYLDTIPSGSMVGDIGCGNGKNMLYRNDLNYMGMDISSEMVKICNDRGFNTIEGDITNIPFDTDSMDYTMSIAVIHHIEKRENRIKALSELLRITKHYILVTVWSFNQPPDSKRKFATTDEMVSFKNRDGSTYYRYYHLYVDGELEQEILEAGGKIIKQDDEKGNYVIVFTRT